MRIKGLFTYSQLIAVALAVILGEVVALGNLYSSGRWIVDADGKPLMVDFMAFFIAGREAATGDPALPYDWGWMENAQAIEMGRVTHRLMSFAYPPQFLFVLAPLGLLPYTAALLMFLGVTMAAFGWIIAKVTGRPSAAILALATPPALANVIPTQNGFLTAALIGLALLNLDARPKTAGAWLGTLTIKPQLGPLFLLSLAAGGRWTSLLVAGLVATAMIALAGLVFGYDVFPAFLSSLNTSQERILGQGSVGFNELQSLYAAARWVGADQTTAALIHGVLSLALAAAVIALWRDVSRPSDLRAAALCAGTVLFSPFVLAYDFTTLILAIAFLSRTRPLDGAEWFGVVLANAILLASMRMSLPLGFVAALVVASLVARRALAYHLD